LEIEIWNLVFFWKLYLVSWKLIKYFMTKKSYLRIVLIIFFLFNVLVTAKALPIMSNKMSWGWLGYNILAWIVIEIINLVCKKKNWEFNLMPLYAWFLVAVGLNSLNAIFFYTETFGKFDRFAHFFLLGVIGTWACYVMLRDFLKVRKINFNIYFQIALIFMFMNTLSVLHEIAEYTMARLSIVTVENFTGLAELYDTADDIFLVAAGSFIVLATIMAKSKYKDK